eukprot:SAG22_NODE_16459_length_324_cov_1159.524444_1_plen_84_part_10
MAHLLCGGCRTNAPKSKGGSSGYGKSGMQSAALEATLAKVKELEEENMELKLSVDGLERERDFYFGKLRDIEIMCQSPDEAEVP